MKHNTDAQRRVLEHWCQTIAEGRRWPSIRELGASLGFTSTNSIATHLVALERKGFVVHVDRTWAPTAAGWVEAGWHPPVYRRI